MSTRTSLLYGAAAAAFVLASPGAAWAQDQPAQPAAPQATAETSPPQDTGEITVTARRFNERLRDVPASVTAFSAAALEDARIRTAKDAVLFTPGVNIAAGAVNQADVQVNIRGLNGARDAETSVALVVDGVLKSNKAALVQNQGVLQQLEVLKGPQGAIYGRNAAAGVFVLTTKKPGDHLEGQLTANFGNNASYSSYALLSGPITDTLGFSLSGDYSATDGFYRNIFLPSAANQRVYPGNSREPASVDNSEQWNIYGRAIWAPTDRTEFDFKFRYGQLIGSAINFQAVFNLPDFAARTGNPLFNESVSDHIPVYAGNIDNINRQSNFELSLKGSHEFDFATLSAYASYNNFKNNQNSDGTSGAFGFFAGEPNCIRTLNALNGSPVQAPFGVGGGAFLPPYSPTTCDGTLYEQHDQRDFSAEIRLISTPGSALQWQAGLYFLTERRRDCLTLELDTGNGFDPQCYSTNPLTRTEQSVDDVTVNRVYAGFASAEYSFPNRFKIGLALRYDYEQRNTRSLVPADARTLYVGNLLVGVPNGTATRPANYFLNAGLDPLYNPTGRLDPRAADFDQLQPKVTLSYKPNDALTLYANWGIGFKSGGFNAAGSTAIIGRFVNDTVGGRINLNEELRKETSSAFEAGFKGKAFDNRLNFDIAGYFTAVRDLQVFEVFVGPFGLLHENENIDRVNLYGFEINGNFRVIRGWNLFGSFNLTESEIRLNRTRPGTEGNKSPLTPDFTINAGTQVNFPITGAIKFNGRADVRVTGPTYFNAVQDNTLPNAFSALVGQGNFRNSRRETYSIVNVRLGVEIGRLSVNGYASNIFNQRNLREVIATPEFGGAFLSPAELRSYGIELGFKF